MTALRQASTPRRVATADYDVVYLPLGAAAFGGAERSMLELAAAQQRAGLRVLVCCEPALGRTDFVGEAAAQGIRLMAVDWSPEAGLFAVARGAVRLFRRLDTRLIQFNISWRRHMWCVPVAARALTRARLLGTMRAMPEPFDGLPRRLYLGLIPGPPLRAAVERVLGRIWARCLHVAVSVNRNDYPPRLVKEYGFVDERLVVIQNGVRIAAEPPTPDQRRQERAALGLADDTVLVACVGRLSAEKGVRYAIEAIAATDARVVLAIAGDGPEQDALEAQAAALGLGDRVRFVGYLANPLPLFTAADVVVVPSLWNEAFGRVVVEAMGCGTPVIATAVGGMQEIFDDGVQGLLVPKADPAAIARAIGRWVDDPACRLAMGRAARTLAVERYSTARVVAEYTQLYLRLGLGSARPDARTP